MDQKAVGLKYTVELGVVLPNYTEQGVSENCLHSQSVTVTHFPAAISGLPAGQMGYFERTTQLKPKSHTVYIRFELYKLHCNVIPS